MKESLFLSGYTNQGKGIYSAVLDTEQKNITTPSTFIELNRPTYLDIGNNLNLYAIEERGDWGGITAFDLNTPKPTVINSSLKRGPAPSHVFVDPTRDMVYSCSFHTGKVYIDKIKDNGELDSLYTIVLSGNGPKPEQDSSHPHFAGLTPDNKLIICDYGTDTISIFDLSDTQVPKLLSEFKTPAGFAPRHLVFHPEKNIAYVICELSSEVLVLDYDQSTQQLTLKNEISTLPADFSNENNTAAAIRISNDGKFLYASNRGHDSIAIYEISNDGFSLQTIAIQSVFGKGPRDFDIDPSQKFVVCANQDTNDLTLFERNLNTGLLTLIKKDIAIPECVCVKFV